MMLEAADAMVAKNRTITGYTAKVSLVDLGYGSVGVDEGWEGCGQGVDHTQHDAHGVPTIDSAFPDTQNMVKQIHALGLSCGWYLNGCKCGERTEKLINYQGDIKDLHDFGFDGVKVRRVLRDVSKQRSAEASFFVKFILQMYLEPALAPCAFGDSFSLLTLYVVLVSADRWLWEAAKSDVLCRAHGRQRQKLHHRKLPLGRLHKLRRLLVPNDGMVPNDDHDDR